MEHRLTGFTLELDGDFEAIERIHAAAMKALHTEMSRVEMEELRFALDIHPRRFVFRQWPCRGKLTIRRIYVG